MAEFAIEKHLGNIVLNKPEPYNTSRMLWVQLENTYGTLLNEQLVTLTKELHDFKLKGGEKMHPFSVREARVGL